MESGSAPMVLLGPYPGAASGFEELLMCLRTEVSEAKIYRTGRKRDVLCRLTYEVTLLREGTYRWFLISIEELE